jgi:hypothetical protein
MVVASKRHKRPKLPPLTGSRFTQCPQCGTNTATFDWQNHRCKVTADPQSRSSLVSSSLVSTSLRSDVVSSRNSDGVTLLFNPKSYGSDAVWQTGAHFSLVLPPLDGSWPAWAPSGNNVLNLTLPQSAGAQLARGERVEVPAVEFFELGQHHARISRAMVSRDVYKQRLVAYPALIEVQEPQPHMAPRFKTALCVHVAPPGGSSFQIEVAYGGEGVRHLEVQPSRTESWRNTGSVLCDRHGWWSVVLVGALPEALVDALKPRDLALYYMR